MTVKLKAAVIKAAIIAGEPVAKNEVVESKSPMLPFSESDYSQEYCQIAVDVITSYVERGGCVAPLTAVAARIGVPIRAILQWSQEHSEFYDAIYDTASNVDFEVLQKVRDEQYKLAIGYVLPETKVFYNKSLDKTIEHTIDKYYVPDLKAIMDLNYQLSDEYRDMMDKKERAGAAQMPISVSFGVASAEIPGLEEEIKREMGIIE
ncbi:hypothetical protein KAP58_004445 [Salmonella enterica]|nr:hypothetical protein [Salmonella enterica]